MRSRKYMKIENAAGQLLFSVSSPETSHILPTVAGQINKTKLWLVARKPFFCIASDTYVTDEPISSYLQIILRRMKKPWF